MSLSTVKRIASRLLKKGQNKIRIKPEEVPRVSEALTAEDVRSFIRSGYITANDVHGVSRARAKIKHAQVKKGRRRGIGTRKGLKTARTSAKRLWILKVRTQRALLEDLYQSGAVDTANRKKIYYMVKGNMFKNKAAMMLYLEDHKMVDMAKVKKAGEVHVDTGAQKPVTEKKAAAAKTSTAKAEKPKPRK